MQKAHRIWKATALTVVATTMLAGCIAYERDQSVLPDRMVLASDGIQPGRTPASWLNATLGAPDSIQEIEGGVVWRYAIDTSRQTTMQALPLIHIAVASKQETVFCFQVSDDVIIRQWRE